MIKFVYFDVGGVLIKDFSKTDKWNELKIDLKINDPNFDVWFDDLEAKLLIGKASFENTKLTLNDFVSRFEMNPSIWPIVKEIKKKYRVGLLTGMYSGMLDAIFKSGVMPEIEWDVIVDSSVFGFKKPNIEIYKIAEEKAGFLGEEILFVDNTKKNLETAQSLGWQTFLYDSSDYVGSTEKLRTLNLG